MFGNLVLWRIGSVESWPETFSPASTLLFFKIAINSGNIFGHMGNMNGPMCMPKNMQVCPIVFRLFIAILKFCTIQKLFIIFILNQIIFYLLSMLMILCIFYFRDENKQIAKLEREQEQLNSSLMALTSHFAQVCLLCYIYSTAIMWHDITLQDQAQH